MTSVFLVRLKEHSSNGKRGGGGGFYLSAHISQSIHPRNSLRFDRNKLNLFDDSEQIYNNQFNFRNCIFIRPKNSVLIMPYIHL